MLTSSTEIWAVVPAAGIGSRMQAKLPKQYLPLLGSTVLDITLSKLLKALPISGLVVVLNQQDSWWKNSRFASHPKVFTCSGGNERADSVLSALVRIRSLSAGSMQDKFWVMVHDAVRPCVVIERMRALVDHCISENIGGILAAPVADTLKRVEEDHRIAHTVDRRQIWQAHTPQLFPYRQLREALETSLVNKLPVTDEASAVENVQGKVCVLADRRDNIKLTLPEDLTWAENILQQQQFSWE